MRLSSGIVIIETMLLSLLQLLSFSILSRLVDVQSLGLWFLLSSLLAYSRIADFWSAGLTSFVAEALGREQPVAALEFVGTALLTGSLWHILIAATATSILWWAAPLLAGADHTATIRQMLPLMALGFWLMAIGGTLQLAFLGFGRPFLKACQSILGALVFIVGAIVLAPRYGVTGILVGQVIQGIAMLLFGLVAFSIAIAKSPQFMCWNWAQFRALAVYGSKAFLLGSVQLSIEPIIRLLANHFGGLAAVTAVELASRLIAAVRGLIVSLGQVLVPAFARLAASDVAASRQLFAEMRTLYVLATIPAFGLLISASRLAEIVLVGRSGTGFTSFLAILAIGWIANTLCAPSYFLLMSQRRMRPLILAHVVMSFGAILLGGALGLVAGVGGALAGASLAIVAASVYLDKSAAVDSASLFWMRPVLAGEPWMVCAIVAAAAVPVTLALPDPFRLGLPQQIGLGAAAAAVVLLCSARPRLLRKLLGLANGLG